MNKKYYVFKLAHGWFGGGCKETDVICTIDSGIAMWHTLILEELVETNEIIEREREFLSKTTLKKDSSMPMTEME